MEWQPIESAPQDGSPILVYNGREYFVAKFDGDGFYALYEDEYLRWSDYDVRVSVVAEPGDMWMPLPPPPKDNVK